MRAEGIRTIRVQADRAAHDGPWRVALERGFFEAEGLAVEYVEGNTRCEDFAERSKESGLVLGDLDVYPVCEWGAIKRVHELRGARILASDAALRRGAIVVLVDSPVRVPADLADVPIAVTWHAGTHYAAVEALERHLPPERIRVVHAEDRVAALFERQAGAATLMEPLVSEAEGRGARRVLEISWRGNIVAADRLDAETGERIVRALRRAVAWLREDEGRARDDLLRDVPPDRRERALAPDPLEPGPYDEGRFREVYHWMVEHGMIDGEASYSEIVR